MSVEPDFLDFIEVLLRNRVEFVVVGAYALAHYGAPRATRDLDVWVRPEPTNAKAVVRALADFGAPPIATEEDILSGKIIQVGVEPVRIDILTVLSGVTAEEIWALRAEGTIGPHRAFFIGRETYAKNKRASGRRKDLSDLEALGELPPEPPSGRR